MVVKCRAQLPNLVIRHALLPYSMAMFYKNSEVYQCLQLYEQQKRTSLLSGATVKRNPTEPEQRALSLRNEPFGNEECYSEVLSSPCHLLQQNTFSCPDVSTIISLTLWLPRLHGEMSKNVASYKVVLVSTILIIFYYYHLSNIMYFLCIMYLLNIIFFIFYNN